MTRHLPDRNFPPRQEWSELSVHCRREHFSASAIAHAVEDCDAHLLNLNVTSQRLAAAGSPVPDDFDNDVFVDIRVSARNGASVARSLERYGYEVDQILSSDAHSPLTDTMRERLDLLIKSLEL